MAIAAVAIGATEGYVYLRRERPPAVERLEKALVQARERGLLGSGRAGYRLHVRYPPERGGRRLCVRRSDGADAVDRGPARHAVRPATLIPSAEGCPARRPASTTPRPSPASPGSSCTALTSSPPSALEHVARHQDLLADRQGRQRRPRRGADGRHAASRHLRRRRRHAPRPRAQGGPDRRCLGRLPAGRPCSTHRSTTSCSSRPAPPRARAVIVVLDDTTSMVDLARHLMQLTHDESCGKCVPCRLGVKRMLETLERICDGDGRQGDIELLEELAEYITAGALCARRRNGRQPGADARSSTSATNSRRASPTRAARPKAPKSWSSTTSTTTAPAAGCAPRSARRSASRANKKQQHVIDVAGCIRCGTCRQVCKFDAVKVKSGAEQVEPAAAGGATRAGRRARPPSPRRRPSPERRPRRARTSRRGSR